MSVLFKKDEFGFHYYEFRNETTRVVLLRSIDVARLLGVERVGTALEKNYIDIHDASLIAFSKNDTSSSSFALYLKSAFLGDHMHANPLDPSRTRIMPNELKNADDEWTGLVE